MKRLILALLLCTLYPFGAAAQTAEDYDDATIEMYGEVLKKLMNQGNYHEALKYAFILTDILKKECDEDDFEYIESLHLIGMLYFFISDYEESLKYLFKALEGMQEPEERIDILNFIGGVYHAQGDYLNALDYYGQSLKGAEIYGRNSAIYARILNDIGATYKHLGDFPTAMSYHRQALDIYQKILPDDDPEFAHTLMLIGNIYDSWGDYGKAIEYYRQAYDIYFSNNDYLQQSSALSNIGTTLICMHDFPKALEYLQDALNAFNLDPKFQFDFYYFTLLDNLSLAYKGCGDYDKALECQQLALDGRKTLLGENHPAYANSLNNMGSLYRDMDRDAVAVGYFLKAKEICRNIYGTGQIDYAITLNNICLTAPYDDIKRTHDNAVELLAATRKFISDNFLHLTEREREIFVNKYSYFQRSTMIGGTLSADGDGSLLYDACLTYKGLLLDTSIEIEKIVRESNRSDLTTALEQLRAVRRRIDTAADRAAAEELEAEAQRLERLLIDNLPALGMRMANLQTTWQDVQSRLGSNDVAIEFAQYTTINETVLSCSILRRGYKTPVSIFLAYDDGSAISRIDENIYDNLTFGSTFHSIIAQYLQPGDNIYFSPMGIFHNLAIEYLPISETERMCDRYNMHRVSSTRQLTMDNAPSRSGTAALYGGLNYNTGIDYMQYYAEAAVDRGHAADRFFASDGLRNVMWSYLRGSREEVEQIGPMLSGRDFGTHIYIGDEGVEETFKALSGQRTEIIHIATHGFYLPDDKPANRPAIMTSAQSGSTEEDRSLLRSGLIFAGANNKTELPDGLDDGILTAREISKLDLRGTDLVVLSACQTGLGDVSGEGVFGLPRAFKKAGAQTLVMSLWSVSDEASKVMMTSFYRNLTEGKSKRESFLEAQNQVRQHTFTESDGTVHSGSEPHYWASFIMLD